MKRVLVAGATGYLGGYAVRAFKEKGYTVRALARKPDQLNGLREYIDEGFIGDITLAPSLSGICQDIDLVFSSVGITHQRDRLTYMDVDFGGNRNLLAEAKKEGVSRFVYVSVFKAEKLNHLQVVRAKLRFVEALKASGLDYLIVNPNGFFSDMEEYLKMAQKGRGYVLGSGNCRINPIHGRDLAEAVADGAFEKGGELNIGGPDILTHREILALAFASLHKRLKITRIPRGVSDVLLKLLRAFAPARSYGPLEFLLTVLTEDMVAPPFGSRRLKDHFREASGQAPGYDPDLSSRET